MEFTAIDERRRVLELLRHFGWNAMSFQILQSQFSFWFSGNHACVAYVDTGRAWVAAGSPVAAADRLEEVARDFVRDARRNRRRVVFFGTESRFARHNGFRSTFIGRQSIFDAGDWSSLMETRPRLREQLRRAQTKGLQVESLVPGAIARFETQTRLDIESLIASWLADKPMPQMGFLSGVQPFTFAKERWYFIARQADRCVGFASMVPVYERDGWLLETLARVPDAPNGTIETLIDVAVREGNKTGFVSLGLTPLTGEIGFWLNLAKILGSPLYNFVGLERFRSKFQPSKSSPIYLTYPAVQSAPLAIYDSLVAFARGSLLRFGMQVLLRRLRVVLRVFTRRWAH